MPQNQKFSDQALLLCDVRIHTLDPQRPQARSMLIERGRITALFDQPKPRVKTVSPHLLQRLSMNGLWVVPGFHDAHLHLEALGAMQRQVDLRGVATKDQCLQKIFFAAKASPATTPLLGFGWNDRLWTGQEKPCRQDLDKLGSDRAIVMLRTDGHAAWLSSAALKLVKIDDDTADPPGGKILRDSAGQATGLLIDRAADLARTLIALAPAQQRQQDLLAGLALSAQQGLTSLHSMSLDWQGFALLQDLEAQGKLKQRVFAYLDAEDPQLENILRAWPEIDDDRLVQLQGVKLMLDGALGSHGAALCEPYLDQPDHRGLLLWDQDLLRNLLQQVHRAGQQLALHAIGDRANRLALDLLADLGPDVIYRRHRIEHAQILRPQDLPRLTSLNLVASMQPSHARSDWSWAEASLGAQRLAGAYAWRRLAELGTCLAFGSDAPIEAADPLAAFAAACDDGAQHCRDSVPPRCLDRQRALAALTQGPGWALGREKVLGTLRPGAWADLSFLNADPLDPLTALQSLEVRGAMVAGQLLTGRERDA